MGRLFTYAAMSTHVCGSLSTGWEMHPLHGGTLPFIAREVSQLSHDILKSLSRQGGNGVRRIALRARPVTTRTELAKFDPAPLRVGVELKRPLREAIDACLRGERLSARQPRLRQRE